ncbi:hypothetical protein ACFWMJ_34035 [Streptomyces hawaiiensis]|uniref:hypothetical protein n=1 Tax=Streptomyces hawaiiensis TaxID=67305 RepID=UPI00365D05B5
MAAPALFGTACGLREELGLPVELSVAWPWGAGVVAGRLLLATAATVRPARPGPRRGGCDGRDVPGREPGGCGQRPTTGRKAFRTPDVDVETNWSPGPRSYVP